MSREEPFWFSARTSAMVAEVALRYTVLLCMSRARLVDVQRALRRTFRSNWVGRSASWACWTCWPVEADNLWYGRVT
jgi:hypothetical protein